MEKAQRINYISFAQIIAMLLIVLSHSTPEGNNIPYFITASVPFLQAAGLVTFMWASGFLAIFTKQIEKYGYAQYIKRRLSRLLIPYFAVSLLMLLPKFFIAKIQNVPFSLNPLEIALQLITPRNSILPHLWFLPTLAIIGAFLPIMKKALKSKALTCIVFLILTALQFIPNITKLFCVDDVLKYLLWYWTGAFFATNTRLKIKPLFCTITAVVGWSLYILLSFAFFSKFSALMYLVLRAACLATMLTLSLSLEKYTESFCKKIGKYTFPIYILSLPFQNVLGIIFLKLNFPVIAAYLLLFVLGTAVPYIIAVIVDKIDRTKILSKIIGM
ncbi:MAG: acyltransferase [Ruminococcaceae bacterium]|nr:acyltransferase [Oscillospiraceae bacterium]